MRPIQRIAQTLLLSHGTALLAIAVYLLMNADSAAALFRAFLGLSLGSVALVSGSSLLRKSGGNSQQPSQLLRKLSATVLLFDGGVLLVCFIHALMLDGVVTAHPSSYALVAFLGSTSVGVGGLLLGKSQPSDRLAGWRNARPAEETSAALLLGYGVVILLLFAHIMATGSAPLLHVLLAILLGLPPIVVGGWWLREAVQKDQPLVLPEYPVAQQDALLSTFYRLLRQGDGRITVLLFAMESQLNQAIAKEYLDQKAKEFNAEFEISDGGSIVYRFDLGYSGSDRTL